MPEHTPPTAESDDVDDAFRSLLEGLRTSLPGVQVLFAFLLALPLQASFDDLGSAGKTSYLVAFVASALASVLLIAPSAHQRVRAPRSGVHRRSRRHLAFAVRLTIAGTVCLAVALAASVFLVAGALLPPGVAALSALVIAGLAAWSWFYVPIVTFRRI